MPFNVREVDKLQQWLLDRYAASAFNVCTQQPLPKMSGPKLELIVYMTVTPVVKHVPAPVPWHFREKVKAGLEADCRRGVLEEVPPVERMSRMITPAKKNGEPRRTVDLSDLNKECKRQTHHTKSPYHLASEVPKNIRKLALMHGMGSTAWSSRPYTNFISTLGCVSVSNVSSGVAGIIRCIFKEI